jgi:hypothetical protein
MSDLHLYRLDDGYIHVMAARDEATALRDGLVRYSIGEDDPEEPVSIEPIPDDDPFTLGYPDGLEPPYPPDALVNLERKTVTAPARVWAVFCGDGVYVGGEEY